MRLRQRQSRESRSGQIPDPTSLRESALLAGSGLPAEVLRRLRTTMDRSGLPDAARLDVLEELIAHFQDGLAAGNTPEDLLKDFGDGADMGAMIRRSKPRGRWATQHREGLASRVADGLADGTRDLLHALRGLKRSPGFTTVAILTLALGIGVNTAVFSVVNAVLLRSLPYPDAEELVVPFLTNPAENVLQGPVGYADYLRWREETSVFHSVGLFVDWNYNITTGDYPERVRGAVVSHRFFEVMGAPPLLGRTFSAEEHERGHGQAAILSQSLWERRFGADPAILGRIIDLDGEAYEVLGVMPPEARWPRGAEVWTPLTYGAVTPDWVLERDALAFSVIARLQAGVPVSRAAVVADQTAVRAAAERPDTRAGFGATVVPLRTYVVGEKTQRALWLLLGSVGFVLLIACANVANLTLERAQAKQKEISIRAAIGAGRRRSVRPLAWECLLVAVLGGGVGMALSAWGTQALVALAPPALSGIHEVAVDVRLLLFGMAVTLATGLAFSLAPSAITGRLDLRKTLSEGGAREGRSPAGNLARRTISVIQLALSVILVLGASMTIKSTLSLLRTDPGFREEGVLSMKIFLPHYAPGSEEDRQIPYLYQEFTRRLEALPGAVSAAAVSALPLSADGFFEILPFHAMGAGSSPEEEGSLANWNIVGLDFFRTMGIPVLDGRDFSRDDTPSAPDVVILSASFAQRLFPNQDAVGQRIGSTSSLLGDTSFEVVGVVEDVRYENLADAGRNVAYVPQTQIYWRAMAMVVRFQGDPRGREQEVREAIWSVAPSAPIAELRPMVQVTAESLGASRFAALLMTVFGVLALTLAAIGVYGVVSVSVRQRYHELGVRRALGAQGREVGRLLLSEGVKLAGLGILVGLPVGLGLTGLLSDLLFEVRANDPVIVLLAPLILGGVVVAATVVPAGRAARVDPADVLKSQ